MGRLSMTATIFAGPVRICHSAMKSPVSVRVPGRSTTEEVPSTLASSREEMKVWAWALTRAVQRWERATSSASRFMMRDMTTTKARIGRRRTSARRHWTPKR